jgi:hypothetical protein
MKKLFTLVALLACVLGAKAEWVTDYELDYSTKSGFPFYVMGYVPEWVDGVMTDLGGIYEYAEKKDDSPKTSDVIVKTDGGVEYYRLDKEPGDDGTGGVWHQYFIADGIPTELDGAYKVTAMVKASEAVSINVNMGWGWGTGEQIGTTVNIGTDWSEVEWEYSGIGGTSCNLVAQPNTAAQIEWKWIKVSHNQKEQRPTTWQQWLTDDGQPIIPEVAHENKYMGDAEFGQWPAWSLEKEGDININWRTDRAPEICAWSLTMGKNNDAGPSDLVSDDRARPYPADIEEEAGNESNHVFAVHVEQINIIDDDASIQWSNQFWIQSPRSYKAGEQVRIKFSYKADKACSVATQWHQKNPSVYLNWTGVGSVAFTDQWQEFDKTVAIDTDGTWSLAFNLTSDSSKDSPQEPNIFYFDNLSWETMVLDEGYFVASSNTAAGIEYDFDNAIEFVQDPDDESLIIATIGEVGKKDTWVNEAMISTVRGNDGSFKSNTLKPSGNYIGEDNWGEYAPASLAKIKLPAAGAWKISLDTEGKQINILKLDGEEDQELPDIKPNPTEVVVNAVERDWLTADNDGNPREEQVGEGQTWDNQFFIKANRTLAAGEVTVLEFDYVATKDARSTTQCQGEPGQYMHWGAIGNVDFTTTEQHFSTTFTVPGEADGMQSLSFDMAVIKDACDYTIKNVVWKLEDGTESLINMEGSENFYVKIGAGTDPYQYGATAINGVVVNKNAAPAAIYNIAGQRVSKSYKGIVVKDGKKYLVK